MDSIKSIISEMKQPKMPKGHFKYDDWEDEIIEKIEILGGMTRSDAQGLVDANSFELTKAWGRGQWPEQVVMTILKKK